MGNASAWGELDNEGLADDEVVAAVRTLLGGLDPAPELSLSEAERATADQVLSRLLIAAGAAPPEDPRRRRSRGPSRRDRWPLAPSSKKRAGIALGVAAGAAALVATVAVVAMQGDRSPASAQPALPRPLAFAHGGHAAAVSLLERASALQAAEPLGPAGSSRYAKTQGYALNVNVGGTRNSATTFVVTTVRQVWVAPGCRSLEKSYSQSTNATTGADVGGPGPESTEDQWGDTNCGFPTSPSAVVAKLVGADVTGMDRQDRDYALADGVMAQLGLGTATPRQVAALYRALESLPGAFFAGTVTDDAGRLGQAVGVPSGLVDMPPTPVPKNTFVPAGCAHAKGGAAWDYFVLSPKTGQPLEVEEVSSTPPCALRLPPGPLVGQYNLVLGSGAVSAPGVLPK